MNELYKAAAVSESRWVQALTGYRQAMADQEQVRQILLQVQTGTPDEEL